MARLLRPWQDLVRAKLHAVADTLDDVEVERGWYHLTNSYNSDGQWPPTLPQAPHIIHPFNYSYCFENLLTAHHLVGGVDLGGLRIIKKSAAMASPASPRWMNCSMSSAIDERSMRPF